MEQQINNELQEPLIWQDDVLVIKDKNFISQNVAIVTGAASGVGRAVAIALAVNGLKVVGTDLNVDGGKLTVERAKMLGGEVVFVPANLENDDEIEALVKTAASHGAIKYLCNIAGFQHINAIEDFPMSIYDKMQRIMLRAPFFLSKLCIPHMKSSSGGTGAIGNMCSVHGHMVTKNKPVYNITKFGLRGLSQSISAEGGGRIRSFTVSVGFVKTPLALKQIPEQARQRGITSAEVVRDIMMGRSQVKDMMTPVEVANLFVFGFSAHGNYLVGGDLLFDGGMVKTY